MHYKVTSSQYVLLLPYRVNTGERNSNCGVVSHERGLTTGMMNALVLSLSRGMLSAEQNRFSDTDWEKPTPKVALASQLALSPLRHKFRSPQTGKKLK